MAERNLYEAMGIDKAVLSELAAKYGLSRLAVFGSFARGQETAESDIDFLVDWKDPPGMFGYMSLMEEMESLTGRKVDIASEDALHWYIKDRILNDVKDLL
jgi:predicted nucleotidyltransferase